MLRARIDLVIGGRLTFAFPTCDDGDPQSDLIWNRVFDLKILDPLRVESRELSHDGDGCGGTEFAF